MRKSLRVQAFSFVHRMGLKLKYGELLKHAKINANL